MRADEDRPDGVERIFRSLRGREVPELDSDAAWRRLRAALPPRAPAAAWTLSWRAAATVAVVALVASLALWQVWQSPVGETPGAANAGEGVSGDRDLVLLAGAGPAADPMQEAGPEAVGEAAPLRLDVRLLREGLEDAPSLGAGGADATADIDATLKAVLPDRRYGMLGRWEGDLAAGPMETVLAPGYRLAFEVDPDDPGTLRRVRLIGERGPLVADEIHLDSGQVYLFGVRDAAGRAADVLLAIRLHPAVPERRDGDR